MGVNITDGGVSDTCATIFYEGWVRCCVKFVIAAAANAAPMLGANGTQVTSKTLWNQGSGWIDVENPNPGQRPGQIHYQDGT